MAPSSHYEELGEVIEVLQSLRHCFIRVYTQIKQPAIQELQDSEFVYVIAITLTLKLVFGIFYIPNVTSGKKHPNIDLTQTVMRERIFLLKTKEYKRGICHQH